MTIRSATTDPRAAGLLADAHALGLVEITSIEVADLVFVVGGSDRDQLRALLVDPMLQTGEWTVPATMAIETALLPGVTDASAQAVTLAAETVGSPVTAVATGTRYEVYGNVDHDTMSVLAKRLLALGLRTVPPKLLGLESFSQAFSPGDAFANYFSKTAGLPAGDFPLFAVLRGNPHAAGRREVFLLFDADEQPVAVIKAGHGDAARRLITHEETLLKSLPPRVAGAPRVRSGFSSPQAAAFAMDFLPGESPTGEATVAVANILTSWLDAAREIPLAELPAWQRLVAKRLAPGSGGVDEPCALEDGQVLGDALAGDW